MTRTTREENFRTCGSRILELPLILAVISPLAACATTPPGVLLPVSATVASASRVDMLVATTRDRMNGAELFSGARGPALAFANITVSLPPPEAREIGQVQWPRQVPGNPATDFVTLKAEVINRPQAITWFQRTSTAAGACLHSWVPWLGPRCEELQRAKLRWHCHHAYC